LVGAGALESTGSEWRVRRKPSTLRRFLARLGASALVLMQILMSAGTPPPRVLSALGVWCSRAELVEGLARAGQTAEKRKLQDLACWIHRLTPGIRLM
jgi:hypothetical protein